MAGIRAAFLLHSVTSRGGGITAVARELAKGLASLPGIDLQVLGLQDKHNTSPEPTEWDSVPVRTCKVVGPSKFGYAPDLLDALRDARPDLIHSHGLWMYPSLANLQATSRGQPYLVSPHGLLNSGALRQSRWRKRIALALYERTRLQRAACVHALGMVELQAIRAVGVRNPVCVIPNGVVLPTVSVSASRDHSVLETEPGQHVLLHLGRIHPTKGLSELLEAWALALRQSPQIADNWALRIVGWEGLPGYERRLREKVKLLQLGERVKFIGPRYGAQKTAALNAADAFVLASHTEGMPVAVLEAWAHGLPVLMTEQCNLPEGIAARAAIPVKSEVSSLADSLQMLFRMSDLDRRQMGNEGRKLVEKAFTWPTITARMQSVYRWLVGAGPYPDCIDRNDTAAVYA